jgi:hypothetical protein
MPCLFALNRVCRTAPCLMMRCGLWALHSCRMMGSSSCGSQVGSSRRSRDARAPLLAQSQLKLSGVTWLRPVVRLCDRQISKAAHAMLALVAWQYCCQVDDQPHAGLRRLFPYMMAKKGCFAGGFCREYRILSHFGRSRDCHRLPSPVSDGEPALICVVAALAQSHYTERQASAKLGPGVDNLDDASAHSNHTAAVGAELRGVGGPISDRRANSL